MTDVVAFAVHTPGSRLSNGYPSGLDGQTQYGVAVTEDGRDRSQVGPLYDTPKAAARAARRLADRLAREESAA